MKKVLLFILLIIAEYTVGQSSWTQKINFGGGLRGGAVGFSIGNKGYVGTGSSGSTVYNDFWEYQPSTDAWTQMSNFPGTKRSGAVGFFIGSKGYVGTGYDTTSTYLKDFWEYNPVGNIWMQKADFPDSARANAVGFSIGAKGYVGTGKNNSNYFSDFWEYDPIADTWLQKAYFQGQARSSATGFSINTKGYIGLGSIDSPFFNDFWEYDPGNNFWIQKTNFPGPSRAGAAGFSIGSLGYVCAGGTSPIWPYGAYDDLWQYNPSLDNWEQKANFGGGGRYSVIGFSIDTCGYIGTGAYSGFDPPAGYFSDFWAYCPTANSQCSITLTGQNDYCGLCNGELIANPIGQSPFLFWWSTGDTTQSISGLCSGTYTLYMTDSTGCSTADTIDITGTPLITTSVSSSICSGDSIFLEGNFQTTAGNYYDTLQAVNGCDSVIETTLTVNSVFSNQYSVSICNGDSVFLQGNEQTTAGTYYDTLSTVNGCDSVIVTTLVVNSVFGNQHSVNICNGDSVLLQGNYQTTAGTYYDSLQTVNGCDSVIVTALAVNQSAISNQQLAICSGDSIFLQGNFQITAGTYYDTLSTVNGCDSIIETVLIANENPIVSVTSTTDHCGLGTGTASANVIVDTSAFSFSWNNGQNFQTTTGLLMGFYYVTVTDSNSCQTSNAIFVNTDIEVGPVLISNNASCNGICDGSAELVSPGLIPPVTYSWSNGDSSQIATNLCAGNYFVSETDSWGCIVGSSVTITQPNILSISLTSTPDSGNADGTATSNASGGTPPYSYLWSNGDTTTSVFGLLSSVYFVTVADANGCSETDSVTVGSTVSISQISNLSSQIFIYPNPNGGKFIIRMQDTRYRMQDAELKIYNVLGEIVYKSKIVNEKSEVDISRYGSGVYYVQMISEKSVWSKKLVIE